MKKFAFYVALIAGICTILAFIIEGIGSNKDDAISKELIIKKDIDTFEKNAEWDKARSLCDLYSFQEIGEVCGRVREKFEAEQLETPKDKQENISSDPAESADQSIDDKKIAQPLYDIATVFEINDKSFEISNKCMDTSFNEYKQCALFPMRRVTDKSPTIYKDNKTPIFKIEGKYKHFKGKVGLNYKEPDVIHNIDTSTADFQIYGDDILLFSQNFGYTDGIVDIDLDVTGVRLLKIISPTRKGSFSVEQVMIIDPILYNY